MLKRLRRSAGLLLALFVSHLGMVAGNVVCTTSGMSAMGGSLSEQSASTATMATMAMPEASGGAATESGTSSTERGSPSHAPCSSPPQGACVSSMPCVIALSAPQAEGLVCLNSAPPVVAVVLAVTMPASSGSGPDLPPPRA